MGRSIRKNTVIKRLKSLVALLLCCVTICVSCYRKPVKAEAAASTCIVVGSVLVATALATLGIGCAGLLPTPEYNTACQNIWNGISTPIQQQVKAVQFSATAVKAQLTQDFLHAVFNGVRNVYPDKTVNFTGVSSAASFALAMGWNLTAKADDSWRWKINFSKLTNYTLLQSVEWSGQSFSIFGINFKCTPQYIGASSYNMDYDISTVPYKRLDLFLSPVTYNSEYQTFSLIQAFNTSLGKYVFLILGSQGGYFLEYDSAVTDVTHPPMNPTRPDVYNPANENFYAQGLSVLNHRVDDVIDKVAEQQGNPDKVINVTIPDAVAKGSSVTDATKAQTQASTTGLDLTDTVEKEKNATANKGRTTVPPKNPTLPDMTIPALVTRKFPFSIPWDLYNSVSNLVAPGAAPVWVIPINGPLGNNSITIDMSKFNAPAAVARWGLSLLFLIGLILLTNKVIKH